jgi:hypothetical protein
MTTTRRSRVFLVASVLAFASAASPAEAGFSAIATLDMTGQTGNFILNGKSANETYTDFQFGFNTAQIEGTLAGGTPTSVRFELSQKGNSTIPDASVSFSTAKLDEALVAGTYTGAQRAGFETGANPGFAIGFDGRGYNALTASFTNLEVSFFHDPGNPSVNTVASFKATFTAMGDSNTGSVSGTFSYMNFAYVPEPASVALMGTGLIALLGYMRLVRRQTARRGGSPRRSGGSRTTSPCLSAWRPWRARFT